jgi:glyoxylase-like metal-dependent hydrolase (beta-lactamase superfamily II)
MKKSLLLLCLTLVAGSIQLRAQSAKASLDAASAALGAGNLRSVEFSGRGFDGTFGQPYDANAPWPRFAVPAITVTIDYATPAMRDDRRRQQWENPPLGGGFQPMAGEQRQTWVLSGNNAWDMAGGNAVPAAPERDFRSAVDGRLTQIWATPHGFVKAALANAAATSRTETIRGAKKTIVTFTAPNKMKFEGVINDQNFVERVETWYSSPVLGDTKFEADFSDYKDFAGVKFPTHIVQRNGPYPILDIEVTDVKPNVAVSIEVPANIRTAAAPPAMPQAEKISDGLWMVQGAVKSVAIEMKDHLVVVEAPETEARSIAVMDALKRAIPSKPIKYLINTHHHFDHSGGLRTYVAEGVTIVTHQSNIGFFENIWRNPHTISPDRLAKSPRAPVFEGVTGSRLMSDGTREVDIYHYGGNMHNPGMLMVYLPRERTLIEADSWSSPAMVGDYPGAVANLVHFYESVERLNLDVDQVVPIHGRLTTWDEIRQSVQTYGRALSRTN